MELDTDFLMSSSFLMFWIPGVSGPWNPGRGKEGGSSWNLLHPTSFLPEWGDIQDLPGEGTLDTAPAGCVRGGTRGV